MTHSRRTFLRITAAGVPALLLAPRLALARSSGDSILVIVRLGGGNDGLNTIIPCEDDLYHRARPSLRIGKEQALPFANGLSFHPALAGLHRLADAGRVAVASNVGYPEPNRSHFRSMDIWHSGRCDDDAPRAGFLAPLVDSVRSDGDESAIAVVDDRAPLALVGARRAAPVMQSLDSLRGVDRADCLESFPRDGEPPAVAKLRSARNAALDLEARLAKIPSGRTHGLPGSKLGKSLATVLDLVAAGVRPRVFYVAHDGFDTHVRQADAHAALLRDFGDCAAAFDRALPDVIEPAKVLLFAFSEFGRRVAENASLGTDHGAAAPVLLVSRALVPGLVGGVPNLADLEDGDVRLDIDFRQVYATLLDRWLGVDSVACLGARFESLPFLNPASRPRSRQV